MATAPALPLFYSGLEPLSGERHADFRLRRLGAVPFLAHQHAVPLTVEEFPMVQRRMPIVFATGDNPVPLALMGLNEGVNVFVREDGRLIDREMYVPAYVRRYPFALAKAGAEGSTLTLCFDPGSEVIGAFPDGEPLFADGAPTAVARNIMAFAEQFEQAGQRTAQFLKEVAALDLLIDGEMKIQPEGATQPFIYRGFSMVDEQRLYALDEAQLGRMAKSGMLALIHAHLFSLSLVREVFARQAAAGKAPPPPPA
jgi:hypothetical protein